MLTFLIVAGCIIGWFYMGSITLAIWRRWDKTADSGFILTLWPIAIAGVVMYLTLKPLCIKLWHTRIPDIIAAIFMTIVDAVAYTAMLPYRVTSKLIAPKPFGYESRSERRKRKKAIPKAIVIP